MALEKSVLTEDRLRGILRRYGLTMRLSRKLPLGSANCYEVRCEEGNYFLKEYQSEISRSYDVQCAWVVDSFYPFMQEYKGKLYMSFTQSRKHIWLSNFRIRPLTTAQVVDKFRKLLED